MASEALIKSNMKITKEQIMNVVANKKVICWSDLLEGLELIPLFRKYKEEHNEQYSIMQMQMGKTLMDELNKIFKERVLKSKDKRIAYLKDKYRLSALGWDALQSCPKTAKEDIDYIEAEGL